MNGLLVALWLAMAPCEDLTLTTARLAAAATDADLAVELAAVEMQTGAPLLLPAERGLTLEARAARAAARAGTACALLQRTPGTAHVSREQITEILERPEFTGARDRHPNALGRLWERFKTWALSLLEDNTTRTFASGVRWAVLGLAAGVAALGLERWWRRRREGVSGPAARPPTPRLERLMPPADHLARARAQLSAAPRDALREGLLALLSALERRGLGRADRAETNAELVSSLARRGASPEESVRIRALLGAYDRRYYSLAAVERGEAEAFLHEIERWETETRKAP